MGTKDEMQSDGSRIAQTIGDGDGETGSLGFLFDDGPQLLQSGSIFQVNMSIHGFVGWGLAYPMVTRGQLS